MKWQNSLLKSGFALTPILLSGLVLNSLQGAAFSQEDEAKTDDNSEAAAESPKTHEVKAGRLKLELKLDGTFESGQSAEVKLKPEAWAKLEVKEALAHGAVVKKGDTLVTLDLEDLEKAIKAAEQAFTLSELSLKDAKLSLAALKKTVPIDLAAAERAVKQAQSDLDYFLKVTKGQSIKSAERSLQNSRYSLEYAQEELNQLKQMYKADDLTEETEEIILKRAERGVLNSKYFLERAELSTKRTLETELPRQEQSLKDATAKQLAGSEQTHTALATALTKAEIALEKQEITHEAASEKLANLKADWKLLSKVTSPIDGYVFYGRVKKGSWGGKGTLETALQPGGTITAKQVFMTVVAPGAARLHTSVSEKDLFQVKKDQTGNVKAVAFPEDSFQAKVESISRIPTSPGSFECVVSVAGAGDSAIMSGMKGSVTIITYDKADAVTVPKSAVFSDDDDSEHVFVVDGDGHRKQAVETGRTKGDNIEIREGLKAGEKVLLKKP